MKKAVQVAFAIALSVLAIISTIWPKGHRVSIVYAVIIPSFILSFISFVTEIAEKCESDVDELASTVDRCATLSKERVEMIIKNNVLDNNGVFDVEKVITKEVNDEFEKTNQYMAETLAYRRTQIFCIRCKNVCDKIMVGGYVILFLSLALSPYISQWLSTIDLNCITMWSLVLLYVSLELKSDICAKIFFSLSERYKKKAKEETGE